MSPKVLRRKLQKKVKRKQYTRCICGGRLDVRLQNTDDGHEVVENCIGGYDDSLRQVIRSCGRIVVYDWTGIKG